MMTNMENRNGGRKAVRLIVEQLYRKHHDLVTRFGNRMFDASHREEFESRCWERLCALATKGKLDNLSDEAEKLFLLSVLKRVFWEQLRQKGRAVKTVDVASLETLAAPKMASPEYTVGNRELIVSILDYVNTLRPPLPALFHYFYVEGRNSGWIAKKTHINKQTVRTLLCLVRRKIKERFAGRY